jgi:hypothetical protein
VGPSHAKILATIKFYFSGTCHHKTFSSKHKTQFQKPKMSTQKRIAKLKKSVLDNVLPEGVVVHHLLPYFGREDKIHFFIHDVISGNTLLLAINKTPTQIMVELSMTRQFNRVEELYHKGFPLNAALYRFAIKRNNQYQLNWLKYHECPWDDSAFIAAARVGNLRIMEWLLKNNCPWSFETIKKAVRLGKHAQWLKDNGCPMDGHVLWCDRLYTMKEYEEIQERNKVLDDESLQLLDGQNV